jgi:hypothetical protein
MIRLVGLTGLVACAGGVLAQEAAIVVGARKACSDRVSSSIRGSFMTQRTPDVARAGERPEPASELRI